VRDGPNSYQLDAQAWYGGDIDKLWLKMEAHGEFAGEFEGAELQALWSRAITPFFDLQTGVRLDARPGPGALLAFAFLLGRRKQPAEGLRVAHGALHRFSTVGTVLVATLIVTGLINSWFLVGPENVESLLTTDYGLLLSLKLTFFAAMLGLAGTNRFRLMPRLAAVLDSPGASPTVLRALRCSFVLEAMIGFSVLGAIAWFGTLPPPVTM
jgi:hypothetical protein